MQRKDSKRLHLFINSNVEQVKTDLDLLTKDRTLNLKVNVVDNQVNALIAKVEQLERSAKDTAASMRQIGSKGMANASLSLKEQLDWLRKIEAEQVKISKSGTKLDRALTSSNKDKIPVDQYKQYSRAFSAVYGEMDVLAKKASSGTFNPKIDGDTFKRLSDGFSQLNTEVNKFTAGVDQSMLPLKNIERDVTGFDKIGSRLTDYYARYEKQLTKNIALHNKWLTLMNKANTGGFASVSDANREFAAFRTEARSAGVEVESFGAKLENTFGTRIRSALSGYGVFAMEGAVRDVLQNVISVDTAMTELKKVTDETSSTYSQFMDNASIRAQSLGATLSEVVNATADYARLGYGIDQATTLADSALIYNNVGDGIESIDDATAALISTMQGFGIAADDSMSIVDKFNNVSNKYASSAGDIGEIVKRSAASMSAAGNSLDETIALGVAANEVQQDSDTVGTALKTNYCLGV